MLIKAAINGGRTRNDHAAVPVSPAELAADVVECLKAGAGAIHLHVRSISADHSEKESLDAEDVEPTVRTVLAVAPKEQVGISTGAWILSHPARLEAAKNWAILPGFASVNFGEEGATELANCCFHEAWGSKQGYATQTPRRFFCKAVWQHAASACYSSHRNRR